MTFWWSSGYSCVARRFVLGGCDFRFFPLLFQNLFVGDRAALCLATCFFGLLLRGSTPLFRFLFAFSVGFCLDIGFSSTCSFLFHTELVLVFHFQLLNLLQYSIATFSKLDEFRRQCATAAVRRVRMGLVVRVLGFWLDVRQLWFALLWLLLLPMLLVLVLRLLLRFEGGEVARGVYRLGDCPALRRDRRRAVTMVA